MTALWVLLGVLMAVLFAVLIAGVAVLVALEVLKYRRDTAGDRFTGSS